MDARASTDQDGNGDLLQSEESAAQGKKLADFLKLELDQLEAEEQMEQQMKMANSMENLTTDDFPLFLTVRRLLYMLDASCVKSFFARDADGN